MIDWKRVVTKVVEDLEQQHSTRRVRLEPAESIAIAPYRGFGTAEELIIRGRVIVEKLISRATEAEPVWRNLVNAYRRFDSDEVPGARVRATFGTASVEGTSDHEGYFALSLHPTPPPDPRELWHEVSIELIERRDRFRPLRVSAQILVPAANAKFGVISDIDDTIVHTGATDLANMVRTVLLRNAPMRLPFEGVASLYQALQKGAGEAANPIFYISSSPWNVYELLEDFMTIQRIPLGPMLLQDFGIDPGKLIHLDHQPHKLEQIELLLRTYPALPFVLMGDSGQKDPEIYLEVARKFASRLRAIFIRDVTLGPRDKAVEMIAAEASTLEVPMFYVRDSAEAVVHAAQLGLIAR